MELIDGFSLDSSFVVIRELIKMDPSLSLFFCATGFSSTHTPSIIVSILEEMLGDPHRQLQLVSYEVSCEEDMEQLGRNKESMEILRDLMSNWLKN